jgi:hypothetical protein
MVDAAIEIAGAYEAALAVELGAQGARALRAGLERAVERSGAAGDLAARRVRSI